MPHPSQAAFQLRPALDSDRDFIWSLRVATMKRLVAEAYGWDESVQRAYAEESLAGQIVVIDDRPVGVVTLKDWAEEVHLGWVALSPEVQGRGPGRGAGEMGTGLRGGAEQAAHAAGSAREPGPRPLPVIRLRRDGPVAEGRCAHAMAGHGIARRYMR